MHQAGHDAEQRSLGGAQAEAGAHAIGVGLLAVQVVGVEMVLQVRIAAWIPGVVDAIDDAGQLALRCPVAHQPVQPGALSLSGDFRRIGWADGCDMAGIEAAGLQE